MAWQAWPNNARQGKASCGKAGIAWHRSGRQRPVGQGVAGTARLGAAWLGLVSLGRAGKEAELTAPPFALSAPRFRENI